MKTKLSPLFRVFVILLLSVVTSCSTLTGYGSGGYTKYTIVSKGKNGNVTQTYITKNYKLDYFPPTVVFKDASGKTVKLEGSFDIYGEK